MANTNQAAVVTGADLAPLHAAIPQGWHQSWIEYAEVIFSAVLTYPSADIKPSIAVSLSLGIVEALVKDFSGGRFLLASGTRFRAKKLAEAIQEEFSGNNIRELARKYGITDMRVRQILWGGKNKADGARRMKAEQTAKAEQAREAAAPKHSPFPNKLW